MIREEKTDEHGRTILVFKDHLAGQSDLATWLAGELVIPEGFWLWKARVEGRPNGRALNVIVVCKSYPPR